MNQLSVYLFSIEGSFFLVWRRAVLSVGGNEEVFVIIYAFSMRSICNQRVINSLLLQSEHKQSQHGKLMWLKIWNFLLNLERKMFIVFLYFFIGKRYLTFTNRKNLNAKRWCLLCNVQAIKREWHISIPITPFLQKDEKRRLVYMLYRNSYIYYYLFSTVFNKVKIILLRYKSTALCLEAKLHSLFFFPTHIYTQVKDDLLQDNSATLLDDGVYIVQQ